MARYLLHLSSAILIFAWSLFVVSFFLPATDILQAPGTMPGTPLTGWEAFTASLYCGVMNPWMWIAEPKVLLFLAFPVANALMLFAPVIRLLLRDTSAVLTTILTPAGR